MGAINEKATAKSEGLGQAEMAHQKRQTLVDYWRALPADKRDQVADGGRIRGYDEGKASRQESWQAIRRAAKTHCQEDRPV